MTDALADVRRVAADLRDVLEEIAEFSNRVGNRYDIDRETGEKKLIIGSEGRWKQEYNKQYAYAANRLQLRSENDRKQFAEGAAFEQWSEYNADLTALKIAKERAHSLRQILSSFQTAARVEADLSR